MASLKRHYAFEIWFLLLAICFTECEYNTHPIEPEIDYTGQRGTIIDIDSNIYQTIGIGTQIWIAENLSTVRLNDGIVIPQITNDSIWAKFREPAYCIYNNDSRNKKSYGLLYNYYAVNTGLLCPNGWHVPSYADWGILAHFAGGYSKAGGKLKHLQSSLWEGPNYGFVENYEFNALPGGRRIYNFGLAKFVELGVTGYFWTADSVDFLQALAVFMKNSNTSLSTGDFRKRNAFNVRCVKN